MKKNVKTFLATVGLLAFALNIGSCKPNKAKNVEENGKVPLYKNANESVEKRVKDLLSRMTLDEKIGQMTQICRDVFKPGDIEKMNLGSILSGGGSSPQDNTIEGWQKMLSDMQTEAMSTRLGIPIIYGIDSVHGNNNLMNATIFPHNIALGAANDENLVERIGKASAIETAAAGIPWTFAPCVAVLRDARWGRSYESFSQDSKIVETLGTAFIKGYQEAMPIECKTAATAKHFLGDGNTDFGSSKAGKHLLDQGDMSEDEKFIRSTLLPPYEKAVKEGVLTLMPSFSSWNGKKMHSNKYLLQDVLKGELKFKGFVVSDWQGMEQVDSDYYSAIVKCVNAGVDMNMCPYDGRKFIAAVKKAVSKGDIKTKRIDDAVSRILYVKFTMGLFENPIIGKDLKNSVRSEEHLALAREAVSKSVVVLENKDQTLPLSNKVKKIYVAGRGANDIGIQCGGWTLTWQGKEGNNTKGTTIFQAIQNAAPDAKVVLLNEENVQSANPKDICIIVSGEKPYAEFEGDSRTLALEGSDKKIIEDAKKHFEKTVLVVLSGRPVIITEESKDINAVVAAWLPGTEGDGVADILFGKVSPQGKLPVDWPKSVEQLPARNFITGNEIPLYSIGYGLTW